ncbi:MAG: ABC transporter ATP-binding protein [Candidatus Bathyarchaeia archaeon]
MLLHAEEVVSGYEKMAVVQGVSIGVDDSQIVTIIGPNGSGKSTLLKTIFGLIKPFRGKVFFKNEDITGLRADEVAQRGMGYVPQIENVFPTLTVEENLEMGAYGIGADDFREELREVFSVFPILRKKRRKRARSLSGGERQMLAIARALVAEPELLLLDEPSASLAPKLVDKILSKVRMIREGGTSLLLVEQNAKKSLQISDMAYVLVMGKMVYEGTGQEILNSREIARLYLGRRD